MAGAISAAAYRVFFLPSPRICKSKAVSGLPGGGAILAARQNKRGTPLLAPAAPQQRRVGGGGIAVPPRGETSHASLGTHRWVGRWQREGPITLGFPLIPSADAETGGRERSSVPWYRLVAHPFAFDLQQIEERATPNGRLSQTGSVPRTLGAGKAAKGPQHLFVTNLGSTGAVSRTHVPPLAAAHPLHPAKENLPAGHAGTASGAFLTPFLFRNSCCCFCWPKRAVSLPNVSDVSHRVIY